MNDINKAPTASGLLQLRKIENLHIVLWLIKDTCWALVWRPGGLFMIFPTVSVALYLTWKSRGNRSELFHNMAVCMWILANSVWMTGEFLNREFRGIAVGFFSTGLLLLAFYYLAYYRKDNVRATE